VISDFGDLSVFQDNDLVGIFYGGKPVGMMKSYMAIYYENNTLKAKISVKMLNIEISIPKNIKRLGILPSSFSSSVFVFSILLT
jgi:hypothetical protein